VATVVYVPIGPADVKRRIDENIVAHSLEKARSRGTSPPCSTRGRLQSAAITGNAAQLGPFTTTIAIGVPALRTPEAGATDLPKICN
jgi:hypothetical protein